MRWWHGEPADMRAQKWGLASQRGRFGALVCDSPILRSQRGGLAPPAFGPDGAVGLPDWALAIVTPPTSAAVASRLASVLIETPPCYFLECVEQRDCHPPTSTSESDVNTKVAKSINPVPMRRTARATAANNAKGQAAALAESGSPGEFADLENMTAKQLAEFIRKQAKESLH